MTLRRWTILIIIAYVALATGAVVTAYRFDQQQNDIKAANQRLVGAAAAYCQAGILPDSEEKAALDRLSRGMEKATSIKDLDPICQRIVLRLEKKTAEDQ